MFLFMFVINSLMTQTPGVVISCLIFLFVVTAILVCVRVGKRFRNHRLYDASDLSSREKVAISNADITVESAATALFFFSSKDHVNPDHAGLQKIRQDITYGVV